MTDENSLPARGSRGPTGWLGLTVFRHIFLLYMGHRSVVPSSLEFDGLSLLDPCKRVSLFILVIASRIQYKRQRIQYKPKSHEVHVARPHLNALGKHDRGQQRTRLGSVFTDSKRRREEADAR